MKKLIALLLCTGLILSLTACVSREDLAGEESSSAPSSSEPVESRPPEEFSEPESEPEPLPAPSEPKPRPIPAMSTDFEALSTLDTAPVTWGPGVHMDEKNRPTACLGLQKDYGQYHAHFLAPDDGNFYLTFDEGYENGYTGRILDVLKEKQVPAVFFVTMPYVKNNPELVRRMIDEGHVVGNHSNHHPDFTRIPPQEAFEEVRSVHDYVKENFGYTMNLFRYPTGAFNVQTLAMLSEMGYQSVFWSFAYADWDPAKQMEPAKALEKITGAVHPGAIFLLHAVSETNTEILPDFIDAVREQGYTFASFDLTGEETVE